MLRTGSGDQEESLKNKSPRLSRYLSWLLRHSLLISGSYVLDCLPWGGVPFTGPVRRGVQVQRTGRRPRGGGSSLFLVIGVNLPELQRFRCPDWSCHSDRNAEGVERRNLPGRLGDPSAEPVLSNAEGLGVTDTNPITLREKQGGRGGGPPQGGPAATPRNPHSPEMTAPERPIRDADVQFCTLQHTSTRKNTDRHGTDSPAPPGLLSVDFPHPGFVPKPPLSLNEGEGHMSLPFSGRDRERSEQGGWP